MTSVSSDTSSAPLPAHWYADEKQARDERELIFHRSWQVAGLSKDVREAQSMTTAKIAGMPVVITRDADGELHAMLNVCLHRGAVIAQGSGPAKLLQCPNHAWVYGLDGKLKSAPRTEREDDYSCEGMDLKPVAVLEWGPLLLVNLDADAEPPLAELATMQESVERYGFAFDQLEPMPEQFEWEIECDWKILIENYLECYHCATVHKDFSQVIDVSPERYALSSDGTLLTAHAPVRDTSKVEQQQKILATDGGPVTESHWHMLFPATTFNVYPGEGAMEITWFWPTGVSKSKACCIFFKMPGASDQYIEQLTEFGIQVMEEDNALCALMQEGMASGAIASSRPLPKSEALVVAFQKLVRRALA